MSVSLVSRQRRTPLFAVAAVLSLATVAPAQEILVAGFNSGVHRYDFATGAFLGMVGNVTDPLGIVHGPDGHVYVAEGSGPTRSCASMARRWR